MATSFGQEFWDVGFWDIGFWDIGFWWLRGP